MHTFIILWHVDYDVRRIHSQLVPTEVKIGLIYRKHSIEAQGKKESAWKTYVAFSEMIGHLNNFERIHSLYHATLCEFTAMDHDTQHGEPETVSECRSFSQDPWQPLIFGHSTLFTGYDLSSW